MVQGDGHTGFPRRRSGGGGSPQRETTRITTNGPVLIRSFCSPDQIAGYTFDSQFGSFAQYKSIYTRKETLERHAKTPEVNVVLALAGGDRIVGFGVLGLPDPQERWGELGEGLMMEVKAVEVCRSWRGTGIAGDLLALLMDHPRIEEMIAYLVGYSWTWDLDGSAMTAQAYRTMLIGLYERYGFVEMQTNEPNICLKPENIFMARIGRNVSETILNRFKWLRFGVSPD